MLNTSGFISHRLSFKIKRKDYWLQSRRILFGSNRLFKQYYYN